MTREEAIMHIDGMINTSIIVRGIVPDEYDIEALRTAIEALSQPIVCKDYCIDDDHIYCSPKMADRVREALLATEVVRCKDCIHYEKHEAWSACTYWSGDPYEQASVIDEDFCSYGERQEL